MEIVHEKFMYEIFTWKAGYAKMIAIFLSTYWGSGDSLPMADKEEI